MFELRNLCAIGVAFGMMGLLSGTAVAGEDPFPLVGPMKQITTSGCVSGRVEGCLFLKSPKGKYSLYVMAPRPSPGRGINVTGLVSGGPNICMAGPGIVVQKWSYNRLRCPK